MLIVRSLLMVVLTFISITFFPQHAFSYCWSSGGGDGDAWLSGKITAGGVGVADVAVSLQSGSWTSGSMYAYETTCTDSSGNYKFRTQTNPASQCYTKYWWNSGNSCNWQSAHCYKQCYEDDLDGWYSASDVATEGYKISAAPPYDSSLNERYAPCEVSDIKLDFASSATANCSLEEKPFTVRVRIKDDDGSAITSGTTVYVSGTTYNYKDVTSSFTDFYVTEGTHYVGAYCKDYQNCSYACFTNTNVSLKEEAADELTTVTLTAKSNNATVSGKIQGSDGSALSGAYISIGGDYGGEANSNGCYAYGWDQTDWDGGFSISLPAGNYNIWVSPPYNGSSASPYASKQVPITLVANETLTENIELLKKDGSIEVTVKDSGSSALQNAWVSSWTYSDSTNDSAYGQSDSNGKVSLSALKGKKYNISASYWDSSTNGDSNISNCSKEGMQTIEAPASNVTFTFPVWDHTLNLALVDANGATLSKIYGGANVRPSSTSGDNWCGTWVNFEGSASASKKLAAATEYTIEPYTWGKLSFDPGSESTKCTTGAAGSTSNCNITMIPIDATISGSFVDQEGNVIEPDSNYISVYATRGSMWRSATASQKSYELSVSAGKWCVGYWLDWNSGYASLSTGSSSQCIDVASGESKSLNLTLLKSGYIKVSVSKSDGSAVQWAWVSASPFAATDEGSDDERRMYSENGCSTNSQGTCTITIGAANKGTLYYVRAHRPWHELNEEGESLPKEVSVTVKPGETVDAPALAFQTLDGELAIAATLASDATLNLSKSVSLQKAKEKLTATSADVIADAFISCFSEEAGYAEATTDSEGKATVKCKSGELWHCFGINQLENNLYISEDAEALCKSLDLGKTDVTIKLNFATTIPDAVTMTADAGSAITISLTDNFSVTWPSGSLGQSGSMVTCTAQPDPIVPYQAGKRPTCFYGYDVSCTDANGSEITQLSAEMTMKMPLCDEQLKKIGLTADDVSHCWRDTSVDTYKAESSGTISDGFVTSKINHMTEFVLVGNGNLSGVDGDTENAQQEGERTGEQASGEAGGGCGCQFTGQPSWFEWWWIITSLALLASRRRIAALCKVKRGRK